MNGTGWMPLLLLDALSGGSGCAPVFCTMTVAGV